MSLIQLTANEAYNGLPFQVVESTSFSEPVAQALIEWERYCLDSPQNVPAISMLSDRSCILIGKSDCHFIDPSSTDSKRLIIGRMLPLAVQNLPLKYFIGSRPRMIYQENNRHNFRGFGPFVNLDHCSNGEVSIVREYVLEYLIAQNGCMRVYPGSTLFLPQTWHYLRQRYPNMDLFREVRIFPSHNARESFCVFSSIAEGYSAVKEYHQ